MKESFVLNPVSPNVFISRGSIDRRVRESLNKHVSKVFWFTGLSGSGKSTLAHLVEEELYQLNIHTYTFDGDNVRHGLCGDLSFSPEGRAENLRRIGEMVKLFLDAGTVCLTAFISPLERDRQRVKEIIGPQDFYEIYVKCPLEVCESRDVKGLYALARAGKIKNYTGISAPYEEPEKPDLVIETHALSVNESVKIIVQFILGILHPDVR
ncbi:MAG: adenylyl-sulfate kinase [Bacteroidia bacterium]|nr:adenylyl-sulfate kinase [Bacteroidia bacterium]